MTKEGLVAAVRRNKAGIFTPATQNLPGKSPFLEGSPSELDWHTSTTTNLHRSTQ